MTDKHTDPSQQLDPTTPQADGSSCPDATEHEMQLRDGTNIFYRAWIPAETWKTGAGSKCTSS